MRKEPGETSDNRFPGRSENCLLYTSVNNPAFRALSYDELADAYREQMEALLEGGFYQALSSIGTTVQDHIPVS